MANNFQMKKKNMLDIINVVKSRNMITKPEIVKITGLTSGTVHNSINELLSKKIVVQGGCMVSSGGRKASIYRFNSEIYHIVGVDVDDDYISSGIFNFNMDKVCRNAIKYNLRDHSVEEGIEVIVELINNTIVKSMVGKENILGIGISVSGPVDFERGIIYQIISAPKWKNIPLAEIIESRINIHTIVDKDNNNIVLYFKMKDMSRENNNVVYLGTTSGIGTGLLMNGSVYRGRQGLAGEFGHTRVGTFGERCKCGKVGCIEPLASDPSIVNFAKKRILDGDKTIITQLCVALEDIDLNTVIEAAKKQDCLAKELLMNAAYYLSVCLSNIIRIYDPEEIIFDCIWLREFNDVFNYILDKVYEDNEFINRDALKIQLNREDDVVLKGAVTLIIEHHLMSLESSRLL